MWLWGGSITCIETVLNKLDSLKRFKNQQVIINFYEEEELIQREGLFFDSLQIVGRQIQFIKGSTIVLSIPFGGYMNFSQRTEFKNYYSLEKGNKRVELYFP